MNAYWSSLFVHGRAVYLLGVSQANLRRGYFLISSKR